MLGGRPACMAQYLSADLRVRVIGAVEAGMSRNAAARRFGVSIASAVRWMDEYLRTGRTAPKPRGGDRRSGRIEAQADLLMRAIEETPDITLADLRERLMRGESFAISTIHDFYRRHGITFKKKTAHASEQARADVAARREAWFRAPARARPGEARLPRRDRRDHQDGPPARAQSTGRALPRRGSAWPLEDDHAGRGPAPRRPHRADGPRRRDERRRL